MDIIPNKHTKENSTASLFYDSRRDVYKLYGIILFSIFFFLVIVITILYATKKRSKLDFIRHSTSRYRYHRRPSWHSDYESDRLSKHIGRPTTASSPFEMSEIGSPTFPYNSQHEHQASASSNMNKKKKRFIEEDANRNFEQVQKQKETKLMTFIGKKQITLPQQQFKEGDCKKPLACKTAFPGVQSKVKVSDLLNSSKNFRKSSNWSTEKTAL